jgi:hypothetical protein
MPPEQTLAELVAEARYANNRVGLYRQRLSRGNGDLRRLGELERIAAGARERLALHRAEADDRRAR